MLSIYLTFNIDCVKKLRSSEWIHTPRDGALYLAELMDELNSVLIVPFFVQLFLGPPSAIRERERKRFVKERRAASNM
jgi:hypothetical protein